MKTYKRGYCHITYHILFLTKKDGNHTFLLHLNNPYFALKI